jgi:hypothetical protein
MDRYRLSCGEELASAMLLVRSGESPALIDIDLAPETVSADG